MLHKIVFVVLFNYIAISHSNRLDPQVFRGLSQLSLPDVGNEFILPFRFNTFDNVLVEAHPTNATYSVHILPEGNSPSVINLFIPIDEVAMRGLFQSQFVIPLRPLSNDRHQPKVTAFYNQGQYFASMSNVHLAFTVHVTRTRREISLNLHHCYPVMEEISVELVEEDLEHGHRRLEPLFLRDLMNFVSKEEYGEMFCRAMKRVLTTQRGAITNAILNRIRQEQFPKSG